MHKTTQILAAALLVSASLLSQPLLAQETPSPKKQFDKVFTVVEQQPQYPGGDEELRKYLAANLRWPKDDPDGRIKGKTYVEFVVGADGMLYNFRTAKSLGKGFDEEAIRVLAKSRQPWAPAKQNGRPVNYLMILPVKFPMTEISSPVITDASPVVIDGPSPAEAQSPSEDIIYTVVEEQPRFPGGQEAMMKYIAENLKYPKEAVTAGAEGKVFVSFVVDKEGNLHSPTLLKGAHPALDAEAIRVVSTMKGWTPGKMAGRPVNYKYVLPIKFKLNESENTIDKQFKQPTPGNR